MINPKDNISPEEKLLRLIRKSKTASQNQTQEKTPNKAGPNPFINLLSLFLRPVQRKLGNSFVASGIITNLKYLNRLFLFLSCVLFIILLLSFLYSPARVQAPMIVEESKVEKLKEEFQKPDFSKYDSRILNKELFSSLHQRLPVAGLSKERVDPNELIKNLVLIGIISEEEPQAVIEDRKTRRTYFLKKGNFLGKLKLVDILDQIGKVILEYEGERFELYL